MRRALGKRLHRAGSWLSGDPSQAELQRSLQEAHGSLARAKQRNHSLRRQLNSLAREWVLWSMPGDAVCAEIGVDEGEFSQKILTTANPRELHLIDPWEHHEQKTYESSRYGGLGKLGQEKLDARYQMVCNRFSSSLKSGQVTVHRNYSTNVAEEFEDGYFDWIYIDGNHLYEFVKADLNSWLPKVKKAGSLAGDDYGTKGWWRNGVKQAVDEFVEEFGLSLQVRHNQFIISPSRRADGPGKRGT